MDKFGLAKVAFKALAGVRAIQAARQRLTWTSQGANSSQWRWGMLIVVLVTEGLLTVAFIAPQLQAAAANSSSTASRGHMEACE